MVEVGATIGRPSNNCIAMSMINRSENVKSQYSDDKNLSVRIRLHEEYSTAKVKFVPWLFENYKFSEGDRILELGCGNGTQWGSRIENLPNNCVLTLSDFSEGMVNIVHEKYSEHENVITQKIDIQDIPYPDESFDVVIANHMLYHVPDIEKALSEVNRVLKSGGVFYSATNGNGGMQKYLHNAFRQIDPDTEAFKGEFSFNLQNGAGYLNRYFSESRRVDHEDSLSVTKTEDLIDWLKSTITISSNLTDGIVDRMYGYFENIRIAKGAINIPKETGLFISVKHPSEKSDNIDLKKRPRAFVFNNLRVNSFDLQEVSLAREYGFGLEISDYLWRLSPDEIDKKKQLVNEIQKGFLTTSFHGTGVNRDIREINRMSDEELLELYNESFELADYHKICQIVFHSNYEPDFQPLDEWIERMAGFWKKFIKTKPFYFNFYIENLADDSPDILVRLIDEIADSRVKVCLDTGHANCNSKIPVTEWIKALGDRIGYVHLHNNDGISDKHQPLSTGTIEFREVFDCFAEHVKHIPYMLECNLKESLVWLKENGFA